MNTLLSNRYTNTILAWISLIVVFVLAVIVAGIAVTVLLGALVYFVAGGLALWTLQWFESKVVVNKSKEGK